MFIARFGAQIALKQLDFLFHTTLHLHGELIDKSAHTKWPYAVAMPQ